MINPQLKETFKQYNIDYTEGILYLTTVFYDLPLTTGLEKALETTIKQINYTHIVDRDYEQKTVVWNIPLFDNQEVKWKWVDTEYRTLFRAIRPDRAGSPVSCLRRMKEFFRENPEVRKEDIIAATKLYLDELTDPNYLQGADYFIKKGVGANITSKLTSYLERIKLKEEVKTIQGSKLMGS